jgi:hypothetical protein
MDSLLDLFLDDYNANCHIVVYANDVDENGKKVIVSELDSVGRFFSVSSMSQNGKQYENLSNAELYVPCDICPTQTIINDGYVIIDNYKYKIAKCEKANIFNETNFTRIWLS